MSMSSLISNIIAKIDLISKFVLKYCIEKKKHYTLSIAVKEYWNILSTKEDVLFYLYFPK